jgi:O-acetyl-ADP-ribose deacetylase (regulator of RNase III)
MSKPTFNTSDKLYYLIDSEDSGDNYEDESDGDDGSSVDGSSVDGGGGISSNLTIEASIALNAKPGDVGDGKGADVGADVEFILKHGVKIDKENTLKIKETNIFLCYGSVVDFGIQGDNYKTNRKDLLKYAIVNAANEQCLGGTGVDEAIENAADKGIDVFSQKRKLLPIKVDNDGNKKIAKRTKKLPLLCPEGEAQLISINKNVPNGSKKLDHFNDIRTGNIIQAVGPLYPDISKVTHNHHLNLNKAYANSIKHFKNSKIEYIGFSLISSGIFAGNMKLKSIFNISLSGLIDEILDSKDKKYNNKNIYLVAYTSEEFKDFEEVFTKYKKIYENKQSTFNLLKEITTLISTNDDFKNISEYINNKIINNGILEINVKNIGDLKELDTKQKIIEFEKLCGLARLYNRSTRKKGYFEFKKFPVYGRNYDTENENNVNRLLHMYDNEDAKEDAKEDYHTKLNDLNETHIMSSNNLKYSETEEFTYIDRYQLIQILDALKKK